MALKILPGANLSRASRRCQRRHAASLSSLAPRQREPGERRGRRPSIRGPLRGGTAPDRAGPSARVEEVGDPRGRGNYCSRLSADSRLSSALPPLPPYLKGLRPPGQVTGPHRRAASYLPDPTSPSPPASSYPLCLSAIRSRRSL